MASTASRMKMKGSWMAWTFWAAGVGLLLVELKAGMEYVEAGLQQHMAGMLGCLPAMGVITLNVAENSMWHWDALELALQSVPMVATGLLLVLASVLLNREVRNAR